MFVKNKTKDIPYDEQTVREYIKRLFSIEQEIKTLKTDKKELKEEYKTKIDMKLVASVIRLVKAQLKLVSSPETVENLSDLIKEKINLIMD